MPGCVKLTSAHSWRLGTMMCTLGQKIAPAGETMRRNFYFSTDMACGYWFALGNSNFMKVIIEIFYLKKRENVACLLLLFTTFFFDLSQFG